MVIYCDNHVKILTEKTVMGKHQVSSVKIGGTYTDRCAVSGYTRYYILNRCIRSGDIIPSKCSRSIKIQHLKLSRGPSLSEASLPCFH